MRWNAGLAYATGLIASDGSLSKDGRHIDFTSKDIDQIRTFARILSLKNKIGLKSSGSTSEKKYHNIQFGNVKFYRFLIGIGLTPHKSKTIGVLKVPNKYFIDFFRGCFDGDGCTYSYWDPRWKSSFMLYLGLASANKEFLKWVKLKVFEQFGIEGKITFAGKSTFQLKYAKNASIKLIDKMYYSNRVPYLIRKRYKINIALGIIYEHAEVVKSVNTRP